MLFKSVGSFLSVFSASLSFFNDTFALRWELEGQNQPGRSGPICGTGNKRIGNRRETMVPLFPGGLC